MGFPGSVVPGVHLPMHEAQETPVPSLGREDPLEEKGNPLQCPCLENPMARSLVGYSPWAHKESDTTENLRTHSPTVL